MSLEDLLHRGLVEYVDVNEVNASHIALYEDRLSLRRLI